MASCSILGDTLDCHFIRQHRTFGANTDFLRFMRESIEKNMGTWKSSVRGLCTVADASRDTPAERVWLQTEPWKQDDLFPSEPKILLYGWHIFHCLYILLYGKADLVEMFSDTEWLLSNDFLVAADHAGQCARESILLIIIQVTQERKKENTMRY